MRVSCPASFRDAPLGAGPESIHAGRGYGFRARGYPRPGMTGSFIYIKFCGFAGIAIHPFKTSLILLASCPARGRFLEATLRQTERELAGPGRPGMVDEAGDDGGAPGGAAPYVIGRARLALSAARGGYVIPASKGCVAHTPGASRRSTPLAQVARGTSKPRTHRAASMQKLGCLKCVHEIYLRARATLRVIRGLDPRIHPSSEESCENDGLPGQARQ